MSGSGWEARPRTSDSKKPGAIHLGRLTEVAGCSGGQPGPRRPSMAPETVQELRKATDAPEVACGAGSAKGPQ
uniref:Uncharacterized protein n=2 Tax=Oryza sativa subsp. japonica TaxID=39947 RepID=Q2R7F4_ORYSJ|nr:hypothetical protein LOC_Os11g16780 [Oryza sativa Japonica Group]ABA92561.1 hypothetical protein LOC_Os11g16780 [Oryza sativa Japonica Group]